MFVMWVSHHKNVSRPTHQKVW